MITHRMVEAFRAVMQSGSVTRAAGMLNISQPSVSRLLADLETGLGLRLFERRGTRLNATTDGVELYDEVERSFLGLARVLDTAEQIRTRHSGVLTVATIPALGNTLLPEVLKGLQVLPDAPLVRLHIVPSQQALGMLAQRRCDIAFASIAPAPEIGRQVAAFPMYGRVILPASHRLAGIPHKLTPDILSDEPMVALAAHSLMRIETEQVFAQRGTPFRVAIETMQAFSAAQLVQAGFGWAIVDPMTARAHEAAGGVSRAFEPAIDFSFGAYAWRMDDKVGRMERFVVAVAASVASLPAN
ncbi:LysR substrate-binding domain-containing protein [Roseomonas sp. CAU 1739]|uniref:LysR substrate-binding domain-containing protein n=1 Tax=Roseomonas sp. CAU 1739 TaxID=3140364 RepID=UPI00325A8210